MEMLFILAIIAFLGLFFVIKSKVWDAPRKKIRWLEDEVIILRGQCQEEKILQQEKLERDIKLLQEEHKQKIEKMEKGIILLQKNHKQKIEKMEKDIILLQKNHKREIEKLLKRLDNFDDLDAHVIIQEMSDTIVQYAWKDILELGNKNYAVFAFPDAYSWINEKNYRTTIQGRLYSAIKEQYRYRFLIYLYPELEKVFEWQNAKKLADIIELENFELRMDDLITVVTMLNKNKPKLKKNIPLRLRVKFHETVDSNLKAIPYMAQIMADYETYGLEILAKELDWGENIQRVKKVISIREIRKEAKKIVERHKEAEYQLAYLLNLYPNLQDIIDAEFEQLPIEDIKDVSDYDEVRDYLSKEEYQSLSVCERNQLALDRYIKSHKKSKWQIGRDYEYYVGYKYAQMGFEIDYFGSYMGLEDLGRDLIAKKDGEYLIVQCKYWSSTKQIHEKHITQLYGTLVSFCIENKIEQKRVKGVLVTNIKLSEMAKEMAKYLGIRYKENFAMGEYPRIKCNIGHGEGGITKIYHLPFDQQYDVTKIKEPGEFFALTVQEAEDAGFRRAFKWFGSN